MARKHTPLTSDAERSIYGAAYQAKKNHKPMPSYVPRSLAKLPLSILEFHLEESKGKKLPKHVKRR